MCQGVTEVKRNREYFARGFVFSVVMSFSVSHHLYTWIRTYPQRLNGDSCTDITTTYEVHSEGYSNWGVQYCGVSWLESKIHGALPITWFVSHQDMGVYLIFSGELFWDIVWPHPTDVFHPCMIKVILIVYRRPLDLRKYQTHLKTYQSSLDITSDSSYISSVSTTDDLQKLSVSLQKPSSYHIITDMFFLCLVSHLMFFFPVFISYLTVSGD